MDLKAIKELAEKFETQELAECADALENTGSCKCSPKASIEDAMSDVLQAMEVRAFMDSKKVTLQEAVREFSKRVRSVLTK